MKKNLLLVFILFNLTGYFIFNLDFYNCEILGIDFRGVHLSFLISLIFLLLITLTEYVKTNQVRLFSYWKTTLPLVFFTPIIMLLILFLLSSPSNHYLFPLYVTTPLSLLVLVHIYIVLRNKERVTDFTIIRLALEIILVFSISWWGLLFLQQRAIKISAATTPCEGVIDSIPGIDFSDLQNNQKN